MKSVIILVSIFQLLYGALEIPEHLQEAAQMLHNFCVAETKVDEKLIAQSRGGYLPDDKNLACYIDCLFRTTGLIDENGHILLEEIMHLLPTEHADIIEKVTSTCETVHGSDPCETAYLTVKCYFEADPANSMLP